MDESHSTKCDKSSFVNGIKERLEKLEKEKNITNFEREKGIKLEKDVKKGIKLEGERSITNGEREKGISLEPLSGGKAVEQCSGHDDEHEEVVEDEVVIRSSSRTSIKRKNAFLRKLAIDIAETSHTLVQNGVESLNHHTSDPLLHSVSNIDSGVYSPLNRSDSSVQVFQETPPPLPSRPPPPRKPPRTFLHDTYMDSRRGSTVEQPDYGLVPFLPEDSGYREVMKFFGQNASHEEHIYEEILLKDGEPDVIRAHVNLKRTNEVPMPPPRRRHALRDTRRKRDLDSGYTRCCDHSEKTAEELEDNTNIEEGVYSDWSDSAESVQLDENKNCVEERKRYLELAKSYTTLERKSTFYPQSLLVREPRPNLEDRLCESAFLLGLRVNESSKYFAEVLLKVPDDVNIDEGIRTMCFPDIDDWKHSDKVQKYYTIILTSEKGDTRYAHCHRVTIEGFDTPVPFSYCVISKHRCTAFFEKILHEVTKCHGLPLQERLSILTSLCASTLPPPGGLLSLPVPNCEFKREVDWKRSELGLDFLFEKLGGNSRMLLDIFSSVLLERRVILVGESISEVSLAVQGLINSIYPLKWQYTLVSILPASMSDMTDAPVPFIMGLLVTNEGIVPPEAGMIINIDSATVLYSTGDEDTILPKPARKPLLAGLRCCKGNMKPGTYPAKMAFLAEIFLDTMVALIGHYEKSLVIKDDGTVAFNNLHFIGSHPTEDCRKFLDWFVNTAIFTAFQEEKCNLLRIGKSIEGPLEKKFRQKCIDGVDSLSVYDVPKKNMKHKLGKLAGRFKDKFSGS